VSSADRRRQRWTSLVCIFDLIVVYGWTWYFNLSTAMRTDKSLDGLLTLLQIAGWIGAIATIIVLVNVIRSWRGPNRWVLCKLGNVVTLFGCIALIWFACVCNFLHVGTRF